MARDQHSGPDGVLVVDKPRGVTSHDVVVRIRRILSTRRVGHVGTLDPLATGVLPLVLGKATRLASLLSMGDKVYNAVFVLGIVTDTYDTSGQVVSPVRSDTGGTALDVAAIETVSRRFVGTFTQTPPTYSAKKIGGVRAYRLARRQRPVTPAPVEVTVRALDIEGLSGDRLKCRVTCAPGFYMRALAHDLGQELGCGACLEQLRRERSGAFTLDEAVTLDTLERDPECARRQVIPMGDLLPEMASVVTTDRGSRLASHGNELTPRDYQGSPAGTLERAQAAAHGQNVKVYDQSGTLLAIAEGGPAGVLHPRIVLV